MPEEIKPGDCVKIPDGRIGRVRDIGNIYKIRVQRKASKSHQFLELQKEELTKVDCPKGWMTPAGYNSYLKITLEKMRKREKEFKQ
jgi:hypothetical protein